MDDQDKHIRAGEILDRMVGDYRADMARHLVMGNPVDPKWRDAAVIARAMRELLDAQPDIAAWLLALAIQRLGDTMAPGWCNAR